MKKRILILCEGQEEKPYIDKIISFPSISKNYAFGEPVNVKGNGNIIGKYQDEYQRNHYDLILIFCDADRGSKQYKEIVSLLGIQIFGSEEKGNLVFIFVNPVTLQVVLSHFDKVNMTHKAKSKNNELIKKITGIENYKANQFQIKELMSKINYSNYKTMKDNIRDLPNSINECPSTNFYQFLLNIENDDTSWVDDINDKLNS